MRPRTTPRSPRPVLHEVTRNCILRINDTKTIELIQEVESEPCLWDTSLLDYPNKTERAYALSVIADKLNIPNFTPDLVAVKFKNLRNSYCQELKKIKADEHYKPKVFWFPYMDKFIKPHLQKVKDYTERDSTPDEITITGIKTETSTSSQFEDDHDTEDWAIDDTHSEVSGSNLLNVESTGRCSTETRDGSTTSRAAKRVLCTDLVMANSLNLENGDTSNHSQAKKPCLQENQVMTNQEESRDVKINLNGKNTTDRGRNVDFCDTFATYIASLMRLLPRKKALIVQPKIVEMIVSYGLEDLSDAASDDWS